MPDRRQGDRRESNGIQNKQVKISLQSFITIVVIVVAIIISTIVCFIVGKNCYNDGYEKGYNDGILGNYEIFEDGLMDENVEE